MLLELRLRSKGFLKSLYMVAEHWSRGGLPVNEWGRYFALLPKRLIDGCSATGALMRRWRGDRWEYRHETDAETEARIYDEAW
ncbi:MAG: hypothetical protein E5W06_04145 [Mesorhizobium sp.]|nr:MAG: hypothetical protein E5W06_04145 [Mesorhizobium sp.]